MTPEELFLKNLPRIERLARSICVRHRASPDETEEFLSNLRLKLIDDDYRALRSFEGKSSLETFLFVTIQRAFYDYRDQQWGRWRPSTEATRMGEAAVTLERLIWRDGWSFPEARDHLIQRDPSLTPEEVETIHAGLPARWRRPRAEPDPEPALEKAVGAEGADAPLIERERRERAARLSTTVSAALQSLDEEDQLILRMRFASGLKIVTIATVLGLDQRRLYRRVESLIATLRRALEGGGHSAEEVREILEHGCDGFEVDFRPAEEISPLHPSNDRRGLDRD
ncbi:MAG: sigma-70 family RNA polymerase sigma factor [Thermoanaerobaculia bacterium]